VQTVDRGTVAGWAGNESLRGEGMSAVNALAETLHLLFAGNKRHAAGVMLDRCTREILLELLRTRRCLPEGRVRYAVEDKLQHRKTGQEERAMAALRALHFVLNAWCIEGRRAAIRNVLRELDDDELTELSGIPELDGEVVSMMREFQN
jgi:hypothetical protein